MTSRSHYYNQCYAQCPPSTVTIQPPPFVLNIPGPSLYCPDQPFQIQQYNPCERYRLGGGSPRALPSGYGTRRWYSENLYDVQGQKDCSECF